jgi:peptide/nickel transport system substrate-binding protein
VVSSVVEVCAIDHIVNTSSQTVAGLNEAVLDEGTDMRPRITSHLETVRRYRLLHSARLRSKPAAANPQESGVVARALRRPALRGLIVAVGAVLVAASVLAATAVGRTQAKPTLTVALNAGALTLDPTKYVGSSYDQQAGQLTNEALVRIKPDGTYIPGLATSWRYLPAKPGSGRQGKDYQITLRHGARFSDGTPVTAQAVKAWFLYVKQADGDASIGFISSIQTIGKWTVVLHLKSPNPTMPNPLASGALAWGKVSSLRSVQNPTLMQTDSYGAGPYMLDTSQTVANDHYTLVPNPYYFDKSQQVWSKVVLKVITSTTSVLQAMEAGQVQVFGGGDPSIAQAAKAGGIDLRSFPVGGTVGFWLDITGKTSKALADVRVRQALNYAVNRKAIVAALIGKYGSATSAPYTSDGVDPKVINYYPYNPAKAKALLAAAGYGSGLTIGPDVICSCLGMQSYYVTGLQAAGKDLAAVGVTLNLDFEPYGPFVDVVIRKNPQPMFSNPWNGTQSMWTAWGLFMKPGALIGGGWNDDVINALWVKGQRASNPSDYWKQITDRITKQAYFLTIASTDGFWLVDSKKVKNVNLTRSRIGGADILEWRPA